MINNTKEDKKSAEKLLIIACSAGGINLLLDLLEVLKKDSFLAVLVIVHRNSKFPSSLEEMAQDRCALLVKQAEEKELIRSGTVYFAPGGYHLLIEKNKTISLDVSEPVNYCRPSIDVSMQSAAEVFNECLVAILLSGANSDGAEGIRAVYEYGGITLVQHPDQAEVSAMPKAAIETAAVTAVLTNDELADYCASL